MSPRVAALARTVLGRNYLALACLAGLVGGAGVWSAAGPRPGGGSPPPLLNRPLEAKNPLLLHLQADDSRVIGWVSGTRDLAGRTVTLTAGNADPVRLTLDGRNTFTWPYAVTGPTPVTAEVRDGEETLRGGVLVGPPEKSDGPAAYFVVDRTAYRPGQPLHFAGFLRNEEAPGKFVPAAGVAVEAHLVSQRKGTRVAKLPLTADDQGRITGEYRFTEGDPLDSYTLSIPGYKGTAQVLLGEYRKSKVRLDITGAVSGGKMHLTFAALDFLEKSVPVTRGSYTTQVVRRQKEKAWALKAEDFVFHRPRNDPPAWLEGLTEEDLLLREAEDATGLTFPGFGSVLRQTSGRIAPAGDGPAKLDVEIPRELLDGSCSLIVQGVVTDATGREQRATVTLPLAEKSGKENGDAGRQTSPVELSLVRQRFIPGEPIEVRVAGRAFEARDRRQQASLVVMKLAFQTPSNVLAAQLGYAAPYYRRRPWLNSSGGGYALPAQGALDRGETLRRTLVQAVPFEGDRASLRLDAPGAYKLIALVPSRDGLPAQRETTVVVQRVEDVPGLRIHLDREEVRAGERLTGTLHSKFGDARALLTLRDSTGIRLVRPVQFRRGAARLDEELPAGLRYGCTLDLGYADGPDQAHLAHAFFRVVPSDRFVTVKVAAPSTVEPGATVDLDLGVDRSGPVDLVVSVYDQSLLGIAPDRATDARNFFLADERASSRHARAVLQSRLGATRFKDLYARAERLLAQDDRAAKKMPAAERAALKSLLDNRKSKVVNARNVADLLRLGGVGVHLPPGTSSGNWVGTVAPDEGACLLDVLGRDWNGWRLELQLIAGKVTLREWHRSYPMSGLSWLSAHQFGPYGASAYLFYGNSINGWSPDGNQLQWGALPNMRGFHAAQGNYLASGNSVHSFAPEGQGFHSHLPAAGSAVPLLGSDLDQAGVMVRRDFSDSAYWNAKVRTGPDGKARVAFKVPDSLTNWRVVVTAITPDLHIGTGRATFRTFKPVMVWPMLPRTFTEGDVVSVFASVHNRGAEARPMRVRLEVENGAVLGPVEQTVTVPAGGNLPVYWKFRPGQAGFAQLLMTATAPGGGKGDTDASLKRLPVQRAAVEQVVTASGVVRDTATIEVPAGVDPDSSRLEVTFAPSLTADLADTLNYLVDYPYGCVEQTMSRFLPAIKVAQILRKQRIQHPDLEKKLPGCVQGGIKRLLELQQPDGGWGWNGNGGTHEMMTPYALLGLLQAEKAGYPIPNEPAVTRGVERLATYIAGMGDAQAADRIYCMAVFTHRRELTPDHWRWLENRVQAKVLSDYALALTLEMAARVGKADLAREAAGLLRARAKKDGGRVYWTTAGFSRWSEDPNEITAAALGALAAHDRTDPLIDGILAYFAATKRGDRWNSTKDTALILMAVCDYLGGATPAPRTDKGVRVTVNGVTRYTAFEDGLSRKVTLPGAALKPGKNTLQFQTPLSGVLYRAAFRYWKAGRELPAQASGLKVTRTLHLLDDRGQVVRELKDGDRVPRGSYLRSRVDVRAALPANLRYVLVEDPRPSGSELLPAEDPRFSGHASGQASYVLREEREAWTAYHLEEVPPAFSLTSVLLAELAGEMMLPPARCELMYQTDVRGNSASMVLTVERPKE